MLFKLRNIGKLSDDELLERYKQTKKPDYFGQLYNRYITLLYGVCLKYLRNSAEAEDAVMQVYENMSQKIFDYEVKVFRTWIYSVTKNHCLQILRKNKKEILLNSDSLIMESEQIIHLFDEETDQAKLEVLKKCLDKLPQPQFISVKRFFMDEMSYADIAEETGYNIKSVKSYIQNGKRNLKICIDSAS